MGATIIVHADKDPDLRVTASNLGEDIGGIISIRFYTAEATLSILVKDWQAVADLGNDLLGMATVELLTR